MEKIKNKVMKVDYSKFFKRFIPLAIIFLLLGGAVAGFVLRTQISEVASYLNETECVDVHEIQGEEEGDGYKDIAITEPSEGADAFITIYVLILGALFCIYWLMTAACLYKSAHSSKMNGLFWLLCGLCGNIFAVLAFMVVRSLIRQRCIECGHWQMKGRWHCTECGAAMNKVCPECGGTCDLNDRYCSRCGKPLD